VKIPFHNFLLICLNPFLVGSHRITGDQYKIYFPKIVWIAGVDCFDHQSLIGLAIVQANVLPVNISTHEWLNMDEETDRTGGL
jgi:hypothetical protein